MNTYNQQHHNQQHNQHNQHKQHQLDTLHIGIARLYAGMSKAARKQVGALCVTSTGIIIPGYNGTPTGLPNCCERDTPNGLETLPEVIHAELNALLKAAKEGVSVRNATMYITLSPCIRCAAMLVNSGVQRVVYAEQYYDQQGILLLKQAGIEVMLLDQQN